MITRAGIVLTPRLDQQFKPVILGKWPKNLQSRKTAADACKLKQETVVDGDCFTLLLLTFGKYSIDEIDDGYLEWLLESFPGQNPVANTLGKQVYNVHTLLTDLKSCSMRRDIQWGRRIHMKAVESRHDSNMYVVTALIRMYGKCGSTTEARRVFDSIQKPDVVCWTALLLMYADKGDGLATLELFSVMKACGCEPDSVTYVAVLKACTTLGKRNGDREGEWLKRGREIHSEIGCYLNLFVQNTLIDMYANCRSIEEAHCIFENIQKPTVVSWNALLMGYVENGNGFATLELFSTMKASGWAPDSVTYVAAMKACTALAEKQEQGECLKRAKTIHSEISCELNIFLQSTLIDMYGKCGSMTDARHVFDSIRKPDVVSWNALLLGYAENGDGLASLEMFSKMKASGCVPKSVTYIAVLKACTSLAENQDDGEQDKWLKWGRKIHSEIGCDLGIFVQSTLIDMYAKLGSMADARQVFDSIQKPDVVSWNALLLGYAENGGGLATLELFSKMKACGCAPDSVTYIAALKACTYLAGKRAGGGQELWLKWTREIHSEIGCHLNIFVQGTLIDLYGKCSSMTEARSVFDSIQKPDVVSWNALLLGYAENEDGIATLELFSKMKDCGCVLNSVTYVAALKACTSLAKRDDIGKGECLGRGRAIHSEIGSNLDIFVQNTLVDMYSSGGSMPDAHQVFKSIQKPNVVSWNALLSGYAQNGNGFDTLDLFSTMKACGCAPNSVTYIACLKACGSMGALALGRKIHSEIANFTAHVVTCLVDFYSKCGSILEANQVFDAHARERDVSTWNALLTGYGSFGDIGCVFKFFKAMQDEGYQPNAVTFVCMLSCCSHAGLIGKAKEYFEAMPRQYGLTPTVTHYNCMVDIMGRCNQLNEAFDFIKKMPCKPDEVTWMTLLGACRKWKNVEKGRYVFQSLLNMSKQNVCAYVLMAQIYGSRGMWEEQKSVLESRTKLGSWKLPGHAYVYDEMGNMVKFVTGEEEPPDVKKKLEQLLERIKELGYVANMSDNVVADAEKCGHNERQAVVYGILKTPSSEPVRAFKNVRMCEECHGSIKMISKLSERAIMIRDSTRLHVMVNGSCSCVDYW